MQQTAKEFVDALRQVMWADFYRAEEDILTAIEDQDRELLLEACSGYYSVLYGYYVIRETQAFDISIPADDNLRPQLSELARTLGGNLIEPGGWVDADVVDEMVEKIFAFKEEDAEADV